MNKILCAAQHFGFGPTSQLFQIVRYLREMSKKKYKFVLIANESTSLFYLKNQKIFDNIVYFPQRINAGDFRNFDMSEIKAVISCLDPYSIFLAR